MKENKPKYLYTYQKGSRTDYDGTTMGAGYEFSNLKWREFIEQLFSNHPGTVFYNIQQIDLDK